MCAANYVGQTDQERERGKMVPAEHEHKELAQVDFFTAADVLN